MRKQHQEMIYYIKEKFPILEWIRIKHYWKNKYVQMDSCNIWVYYHDICVFRYTIWTDVLYLNFMKHEYATNSTAWIMKDMVEWLFGWKRLPRWWWIVDKNWQKYIFDEYCRLYAHTKDLCCYPDKKWVERHWIKVLYQN